MALTGNKGEWSEIYALFKLLGDTNVFAGDESLNRIEDLFYPIIKILRKEERKNFEYKIEGDLVFISGGEETLRIPIDRFKEQAAILLKNISISNGSFSIPETELFMSEVHCEKIKADSYDKADIRIVIHDSRTGINPLLGFSIKSQLGGDSTLLNAGRTTNFIYKIVGATLSEEQVNQINAIDSRNKIRDRITQITQLGGSLIYESMENIIFMNNLTLIDSLMPQIMAESLKTFFTTTNSSVKSIANLLEQQNHLNFNNSNNHKFYEYKIKRLLTDVALGMVPSRVWAGEYDANGGYLVVKADGDVICYHIYNKNEFENYLFANTKFETASSSRHGFGFIEQRDNESYFKLNLQIRFIS